MKIITISLTSWHVLKLSSFKIPFIETRLVIHPLAYGITKALRNAICFQRLRYLCMRLAVCSMTSWEPRHNLACSDARVWCSEKDLKIHNRGVIYGTYTIQFRRKWQAIWLRAQGGLRMLVNVLEREDGIMWLQSLQSLKRVYTFRFWTRLSACNRPGDDVTLTEICRQWLSNTFPVFNLY